MKRLFLLTAILIGTLGCGRSDRVTIDNGCVSLGFERQTGKLVSFVNKVTDCDLIDLTAVESLPWSLSHGGGEVIPQNDPMDVQIKKKRKDQVRIVWIFGGEMPLEVKMDVWLEKGQPMSHWRTSFNGLINTRSSTVTAPVISGIRTFENADLVMPSWLGNLIHDPAQNASDEKPARFSQGFPGGSAQMVALYDRESLTQGLYFSTQDTVSTAKRLTLSFTSSHVELSSINTIPDKGKTDEYSPGYDVVLGLFDGDWIDAANLYRQWAVNQKFCRESRFHSGKTPEWLRQTAFWVWNRGRSSNVLKEAEDIQERLGLPVNAYWHWWHGCPYDEGFPEYIPPKEGIESFKRAVEHAHQKGIHSLVYMNSYQWGDSTESWKDEGAEAYAARRENGNTYRHVYEIFSGNGLTPMCMDTQFWRDKYSSLSDTVVNHYHVDGVYMDQACSSMPCYNPEHGHSLGGGSYWVDGFGKLTKQIRDAFGEGSQAMLAGEGSAEDWMPLLDDFLTLDPARERYTGVSNAEPIPLFQAIYHDYAMTYGSYSSLVYPPYDELWPKEFNPTNAETLLPEEYNMQFRMEQARAFTWGMQPTLANYHSFLFEKRKDEMAFMVDIIKTRYNALEYLLYGEMKGLPKFPSPEMTIPISKVSIYAGRYGDTVTRYEKRINTIFSGLWLSKQGNLGVAITNIADEPCEVSFKIDAERYGIASNGVMNLITANGKEPFGTYNDGGEIHCTMPPRSSRVIELTR